MTEEVEVHRELARQISTMASNQSRLVVAIAGPPGSGKSTLAEALLPVINTELGADLAVILPMDGYHLDNALLDVRGQLDRKGSPPTFDVAGFESVLHRIATGRDEVIVPVFDRTLDLARAGARVVTSEHGIILVEGNYLLLDQQPWCSLQKYFDYTVYLQVEESVLMDRLTQRWLDHGLSSTAAQGRAASNDLPNARLVAASGLSADRVISAG